MKVDISDLIGKPFLDNGRDSRGYDCYGLAITVCKRYGHELPDYAYVKSVEQVFIDKTEDAFNKVGDKVRKLNEREPLEESDVITFLTPRGNIIHIGVMVNSKQFIHCDKHGVHIEHLDTYFRKNWGAYRWQ